MQLLSRFLLGGIFLWAAISKVSDVTAFAQEIGNYRVLPASVVNVTAITLPWIELIAASCLILGIWTRGAALVCGGLLIVFTGALGAAIARGLDIECGCFGKSEGGGVIGWSTVARDVIFVIPAVMVFLFDRGRYGLGVLFRR